MHVPHSLLQLTPQELQDPSAADPRADLPTGDPVEGLAELQPQRLKDNGFSK